MGVGLICAKIALIPLAFDLASDIPFTVVKGLLSHALAYVLAGVIVGLLIHYGRAVLVFSWLHLPVAAFLAVNIAATVFAADHILALFGAHGRMVGLATIADGVLLYLAIVVLLRTRGDALAAFTSGLAASVLVIAYGLIQFAGRDPIAWGISSAIRPFSTLGQTTSLAEYLTVVVICAAVLGIFEVSAPWVVRALLLLISTAALGGVITTQTRSAILGLGAAAALLVVIMWAGHPSRRARMLSLGGSVAASAAFVILVMFTPLGARLLSTVDFSVSADAGDEGGAHLEESAAVRIGFYRVALDMVRERPLLGFGPDNFAVGLAQYRPTEVPAEVRQGLTTSAHGWVTQIGSATGILGLLSFVGIAVGAVALTMKAGFRPAAWAGAGMLAALLGAGLTTVNAVSTEWLFWASVGAVAAATAQRVPDQAYARPPKRSAEGGRRRQMLRPAIALSCAVLGAALAFTATNALGASHAARESQQFRLAGHPQLAVDAGLRATALDSLRAPYWDTLGLAYVSADRLKQAVAAFDRATSLAPYDVRYSGDLARAYVTLVQQGEAAYAAPAREVAERAVRTDPNNPQANLTRALVMAVTGDLPEAASSFERALELDPSSINIDLYVIGSQIYRATGRNNDAVAISRLGVALRPETVPVRIELARALAATGESAQAIVELDAVLAIRPNDPVALQLRSQLRSKVSSP